MSDLRSLIRRGRDLDRQAKLIGEELKTIKGKLIAAGAGKHDGTDGASASVTFPAATLKPDAAAVQKVRDVVGEVYFPRLFTETVNHKAVKGFREILRVLLPDQRGADLIAACEEPSAPQVRFS